MSIITEAMARAALAAEAKRLGVEPYQLEMARAVPTETIQALVNDLRRPSCGGSAGGLGHGGYGAV
jgi:hypothetical protein